MVWPSPVRTKSSMVSAWAVRGRVKAEARRVRVKRALLIAGFPSCDSVDQGVCGFRMRPLGRGVKSGDWTDAASVHAGGDIAYGANFDPVTHSCDGAFLIVGLIATIRRILVNRSCLMEFR